MIKKGKRARITFRGEALISSRALASPRLQRTELAEKLQDEFRRKPWPVPQLETLERKISEYRNMPEGPLDRPWGMGDLVNHPIPPEALPTVLRAWAQYRKQGDTFTIREALWISRLAGVLTEFEKVGDKNRNLANLAQWYAIQERAYEAIGEDIDTSDLDTEVLRLLKLEEDEQKEGKATPWVVEGDYLKDNTGKIRGQIRALKEDPYQPKAKGKKGGRS